MAASYGPPVPDFAASADWLRPFMRRYAVTSTLVSHVVGVNPGRIWEWSNQRAELPGEVQGSLESWATAGCPRFQFWI